MRTAWPPSPGEECTVVVAGELTSADVLIVQEAVVEQDRLYR